MATSTRNGGMSLCVDLERRAQPGHRLIVPVGQVRALQLLLPLRGEGMQADAEQRLHLLRSHRIASLQTVDPGQPGTDPHTGALTALGVVAGERDVALLGRIQRRYLPGQIVVPRPGGQLVDAHRHASQKDGQPSSAVSLYGQSDPE